MKFNFTLLTSWSHVTQEAAGCHFSTHLLLLFDFKDTPWILGCFVNLGGWLCQSGFLLASLTLDGEHIFPVHSHFPQLRG